MIHPPKELLQELEQMESSYKFISRRHPVQKIDPDSGERRVNSDGDPVYEMKKNPKSGEYELVWKECLECHIVDNHYRRVYAKAQGRSEQEAFANAVKKARGSARPMSPSMMLQENVELRRQIEVLKAGGKVDETAPATLAEGVEPGEDDVTLTDEQLAGGEDAPTETTGTAEAPNLTTDDIVQALRARNLDVPEGNKKSNAWREEALALINS